MDKQAFEPTGLVPRSIIRTVERFRQQLLPGTEAIAIQEFRISRYQVLVSLKSLATLLCVPIAVNLLVKTLFLSPTVEYFWNVHQNEIFLNSYQEDRALLEMQNFSEKVFFESLLAEASSTDITHQSSWDVNKDAKQTEAISPRSLDKVQSELASVFDKKGKGVRRPPLAIEGVADEPQLVLLPLTLQKGSQSLSQNSLHSIETLPKPNTNTDILASNQSLVMQQQFQHRATQLAIFYNRESLQAIINLLGDCVTFLTVFLLSVWMRPQIIILKSFLTESIYSLSDTSKSFLLILCTDLLVGFHSPRGWEIAIESLLRHFGLPENQDFIFLFVAAFPVFLDTIFKYWIFRYLNKISPSTVATYHNMIE
jgi:hypothetical protein